MGKQISIDTLQYLTDEGLALWFMDDGYLDYKNLMQLEIYEFVQIAMMNYL